MYDDIYVYSEIIYLLSVQPGFLYMLKAWPGHDETIRAAMAQLSDATNTARD